MTDLKSEPFHFFKGLTAMLPKAVFERLTRAAGVRSERKASERRGSPRVPVRVTASAFRIDGGKIGAAKQVRMKDLSLTGAAMLTGGAIELGAEFLIRLQPTPTSSGFWIWCMTVRQTEFDRTCVVTSCAFLKLLAPGQTLASGRDFACMNWIDVEGDLQPDEGTTGRFAA